MLSKSQTDMMKQFYSCNCSLLSIDGYDETVLFLYTIVIVNFFLFTYVRRSEVSWTWQKRSPAIVKDSDLVGRNVTNHWMCHDRMHPGYVVIDHLAHQILNHVCHSDYQVKLFEKV